MLDLQSARPSKKELTFRTALKCLFCGQEYNIEPDREDERLNGRLLCTNPSCVSRHKWIYGSLDVQYDYDSIQTKVNLRDLFANKARSMWDYEKLLPVGCHVSLGEGGTRMLDSEKMAHELDIEHVNLKYEGTNPTGSFKDRESAVVINRALEIGARGVTCVSSGNAAASLASIAARSGLACVVFTPSSASMAKQALVRYSGARLITVDGIFEDVWELVNQDPDKDLSVSRTLFSRYYDSNPALNPYRSEGDKTTAYEIVSDLHEVPDWVVVPIGNGSNLYGIWKGFKELYQLDITSSLPRMLGVQATGADPVAQAWLHGTDQSIRIDNPEDSIAEGIVAKDSYDAPKALRAVRESNGGVSSVPDNETIEQMFRLSRNEGLLVEPTSATVLAGAKRFREQGLIDRSDTVALVLTGAGFKTIDTLIKGNIRDKSADLFDKVRSLLL